MAYKEAQFWRVLKITRFTPTASYSYMHKREESRRQINTLRDGNRPSPATGVASYLTATISQSVGIPGVSAHQPVEVHHKYAYENAEFFFIFKLLSFRDILWLI